MRAAAVELLPLQDRIARLEAEAQDLDRRRTNEAKVTEVEAMPYLGRFLATVKREMERIDKDRTVALHAADLKRQEVVDAWQDLRGKETLRESLLDRLQSEQARVEQVLTDELAGQIRWRRTGPSRRPVAPE